MPIFEIETVDGIFEVDAPDEDAALRAFPPDPPRSISAGGTGLSTQQMEALARGRANAEAGIVPEPHNAPDGPLNMQSPMDAAMRGVADIPTFGFGDEVSAWLGAKTGIGGKKGDYEGNLAVQRALDEAGGAPRLAGQVAGAFAVPGVAARTTLGAVGQGAAVGGAYGFGSGEGSLAERAPGAALGMMAGGAAGGAAHKVADALMSRAAAKAVPTLQDLRAASDAGYKAADAAGVIVKPEGLQRLSSGLKDDLTEFGYLPALHPKVGAVLAEADRLGEGNTTFKGVELLRRVAKNAAASTDPSEAAIGSRIVRRIEAYMENLPADDVLTGNAAQASEGVKAGRENWAKMRRGEMVDNAVLRAERRAATSGTGGNADNVARQNVRAILDNPKRSRGMTPREKELADAVVMGTPSQNALRFAGRLSPTTGGLSAMLNLGAAAFNPYLAIPGAVGMAAKAGADAMTKRNVRALSEAIRSGGSTAQELTAQAVQGKGRRELIDAIMKIKGVEKATSPAISAIAAALMDRAAPYFRN